MEIPTVGKVLLLAITIRRVKVSINTSLPTIGRGRSSLVSLMRLRIATFVKTAGFDSLFLLLLLKFCKSFPILKKEFALACALVRLLLSLQCIRLLSLDMSLSWWLVIETTNFKTVGISIIYTEAH